MKIIFLDIDGVLNSAEFAERNYQETGRGLVFEDFLDPDLVSRMTDFMERHQDVRIVLSSSWRYRNYQETVDKLSLTKLKPLVKYFVGDTPGFYDGHRGNEIKWFIEHSCGDNGKHLRKNGGDILIDQFCIVDDEDFDSLPEHKDNFVLIDSRIGITDDDFEKIENILKL